MKISYLPFLMILFISLNGKVFCQQAAQLIQTGDSLNQLNNPAALDYFSKAYAAAEVEGKYDLQFSALYKKGIYFDITGKGDSSLFYFEKSSNLAIRNKKWLDVARARNSKGVVEFRAGNYTKSLSHYFEALKAAEIANDKAFTFKVNNNIGHVYFYIDPIKASIYYNKNLILAREQGDSAGVRECYMNLGNVYNNLENCEKALEFYNLSLDKNNIEENVYARAHILQNMSVCENKMGNYGQAEIHLRESLRIFESMGDKEGIAQSYVNLGNLLIDTKKYAEANRYLSDALALSLEINSKEGQRYSLEGLITIDSTLKNYKQAFIHASMLAEIKNQLLNTEIAGQVAKMEAVYQNEKKQLQIENLNTQARLQEEEIEGKNIELKLQNLQKIGFGVGFGIALLLAGIVFFAYRQKQKTNHTLNLKNQIIQQALEEKELLMKEIHHRAKNNLQVVSGLLSLQSTRISDEKSKDAILEATNRVKSMALIHEQLYQPGAQTDINIKTYLEDLTESLYQSYNLSGSAIEVNKNIEDLKLDVDVSIPLGIIANELMSNAFKHAFEANRPGKLTLNLFSQQEEIVLEVIDNGSGVPEGFDFSKAKSFGMHMVHSLAKKIHAVIHYVPAQGTYVKVQVPVGGKVNV